MTRAEQKAEIVYPAWRNGIGDEFSQNSAYYGFINGYEQAEKDLALTAGKIKKILDIAERMQQEGQNSGWFPPEWYGTEQFYEELLKRYNNEN